MEAINLEFVRRADGTVEPFEPERITRSLFGIAQQLHQADPFLIRELTESIVHFLETESTTSTLLTADIADTVIRVTRELGYPQLSAAYEARPKQRPTPAVVLPPTDRLTRRHAVGRTSDTHFSLQYLFPNELVTAHRDGLITIGGLTAPMELVGRVDEFRGVGEYVAEVRFDWPAPLDPSTATRQYAADARERAQLYDVRILSHLKYPHEHTPAMGDLFPTTNPLNLADLAMIFSTAATIDDPAVAWHWHLNTTELDSPLPWLEEALYRGEFVFDQSRRPTWLGPGLSDRTEAALLTVQIHLDQLVQMLGGWPIDASVLCAKAAALARFAKTAGHVKQDWLRQHGGDHLRAAFLLERAPVVIVPTGLAQLIHDHGLWQSDLPRQLLEAIRHALESDRPRQIPVALDSVSLATAWARLPVSATRTDWKFAGQCCTAAGGGLIMCEFVGPPQEAQELIKQASKLGVTRLRFVPPTNSLS